MFASNKLLFVAFEKVDIFQKSAICKSGQMKLQSVSSVVS